MAWIVHNHGSSASASRQMMEHLVAVEQACQPLEGTCLLLCIFPYPFRSAALEDELMAPHRPEGSFLILDLTPPVYFPEQKSMKELFTS